MLGGTAAHTEGKFILGDLKFQRSNFSSCILVVATGIFPLFIREYE